MAAEDIAVVLGWLDARTIAGNADLEKRLVLQSYKNGELLLINDYLNFTKWLWIEKKNLGNLLN